MLILQEMQERFDLAKIYRDHISQVAADRALEDFVAAAWHFLPKHSCYQKIQKAPEAQSPLAHPGNALSIHVASWLMTEKPSASVIVTKNLGMCELVLCLFFEFGFHQFHPEDGMDQAKWSIPRSRGCRMTKSEAPLLRPRIKIEGVWTLGS